MEIVLVAGMDEEGLIGQGGDLPWHLPADLQHFKSVTMGSPIVMGRRTFESIGRALPGRLNLVLTTRSDVEAPGCVVLGSIAAAVEAAESEQARALMVIGGATLFEEFLPRADRMVLTVVHGQYEGDTYFPVFEGSEWEVLSCERRKADEKNPADMSFVELVPRVKRPRTVHPPGPSQVLLQMLLSVDS